MRLDGPRIKAAAGALAQARETAVGFDFAVVEVVAVCLHSVVGASKVLHFVRPNVYPIWDTKVERVWRRFDPSQSHMSRCGNYVTYVQGVSELLRHKHFPQFSESFRAAHFVRLKRLEIPSYDISDVRVVESAAFELSGGEYEDS